MDDNRVTANFAGPTTSLLLAADARFLPIEIVGPAKRLQAA